ncbi:MAG: PD-(D/E)XK nuclease family protein, partial [Mailhella sp.]|nr:PD-(D/E)XK nuclease family protein [Mailhella sp.]
FARGGVTVASSLGADRLVFGSESGDGELVEKLARIKASAEYKQAALAAEICGHLIRSAEHCSETLSISTLGKLLDSAIGAGERIPAPADGRKSAMPSIESPARLRGRVRCALWWDATDPGSSLRPPQTWEDAEFRFLEERGITPPLDYAERRRAEAHGWKTPFALADSLVLIVPEEKAGEAVRCHPVFPLLGIDPKEMATLTLEEWLQGADLPGLGRLAGEAVQPSEPTPVFPNETGRELRLPSTLSPTSAENLVSCPARWYLEKMLHIRPGRSSLQDAKPLMGNLAHDAVESILLPQGNAAGTGVSGGSGGSENPVSVTAKAGDTSAHAGTTPDATPDRIEGLLLKAAAAKGARFTHPGARFELSIMAERLAKSLSLLRTRLEEKDLHAVASELDLPEDETKRPLIGGIPFHGRCDLLLARNGSTEPAGVVDLKYSSNTKKFEDHMLKGSVQLEAYRRLTGASSGIEIMYALLENACILAESDSPAPYDSDTFWEKLKADIASALDGIRSGRLSFAEEKEREAVCKYCGFINLCPAAPKTTSTQGAD